MKYFINSILCLGLVSMIVSVDITNAKELSEYQNPVNIEKIADEMNVTTEDLVETFLNLDSYLNEVESQPEMLTISDEGETVSQQVIRLDNGLLIVKETEIESIVPYATTKELHTHYFVKDPLGASTAVTLTTDVTYQQQAGGVGYIHYINSISGRYDGYLYSVNCNGVITSQGWSKSPVAKEYYYLSFMFQGSPFSKTIVNTISFAGSGAHSSRWS